MYVCVTLTSFNTGGAHTFMFIALKSKTDLSFIEKKVGSVTGHRLHLTTLNATLLGEIQSSCSRQMAVAV